MLSNDAYEALQAHKGKNDSLSSVILRFVPKPIKTFGDLEDHLNRLERPVIVDEAMLERIRRRKQKANRAD